MAESAPPGLQSCVGPSIAVRLFNIYYIPLYSARSRQPVNDKSEQKNQSFFFFGVNRGCIKTVF